MPNLKASKESVRKDAKKTLRNKQMKARIRTLGNAITSLMRNKKKDEALSLLDSYYRVIDKAAQRNVLKKKTVARKKSRITQFISSFDVGEIQSEKNKLNPEVQ